MIQSVLMMKLTLRPHICMPAPHMASQVYCTYNCCCYQWHLHTQCLIVVVQGIKSDDGNYEDIPSDTHEGSEPTYAGVVN